MVDFLPVNELHLPKRGVMATYFLTSLLATHIEDENDVRIPIAIKDENLILTNLKRTLKKHENLLIVANDPADFERNDDKKRVIERSFSLTGLPFEHADVLDNRTIKDAKKLLKTADLVYLCGGSIIAAKRFYRKIKLAKRLRRNDCAVIGVSAGSMWQTKRIFNFPESEEEAGLPLWVKGFGFCDDIFIPHFDGEKMSYQIEEVSLDVIQKWILPHSNGCKMLGFPDGSYLLIENGKKTVFGTYYEIENRAVKTIRQ